MKPSSRPPDLLLRAPLFFQRFDHRNWGRCLDANLYTRLGAAATSLPSEGLLPVCLMSTPALITLMHWRDPETREAHGVLTDFDLVTIISDDLRHNKQRTRTRLFMVIELLAVWDPIVRQYYHDLDIYSGSLSSPLYTVYAKLRWRACGFRLCFDGWTSIVQFWMHRGVVPRLLFVPSHQLCCMDQNGPYWIHDSCAPSGFKSLFPPHCRLFRPKPSALRELGS
jgi:hypothetical protein